MLWMIYVGKVLQSSVIMRGKTPWVGSFPQGSYLPKPCETLNEKRLLHLRLFA